MTVLLFRAREDPASWQAAIDIRRQVFIDEQGVPESEELDSHDEGDPSCIHALASVGSAPAATGRLYEPSAGVAKIGRMAVLRRFRGLGTGMAVLDALIKEGRRRGIHVLTLDAQLQATDFYAKRGFRTAGEPFLDCGIPHQVMVLADRAGGS